MQGHQIFSYEKTSIILLLQPWIVSGCISTILAKWASKHFTNCSVFTSQIYSSFLIPERIMNFKSKFTQISLDGSQQFCTFRNRYFNSAPLLIKSDLAESPLPLPSDVIYGRPLTWHLQTASIWALYKKDVAARLKSARHSWIVISLHKQGLAPFRSNRYVASLITCNGIDIFSWQDTSCWFIHLSLNISCWWGQFQNI